MFDASHFHPFSPSQGESGHVEGASCRVDKASKVAMNNLRRASSFVCDVDLFFNVSPQIILETAFMLTCCFPARY